MNLIIVAKNLTRKQRGMKKLRIRTHRGFPRFVDLILDNKDYFFCSTHLWRLDRYGRVVRRVWWRKRTFEVSLARELMQPKTRNHWVRHKNGDKFDFRRKNLQIYLRKRLK